MRNERHYFLVPQIYSARLNSDRRLAERCPQPQNNNITSNSLGVASCIVPCAIFFVLLGFSLGS